MKTAGIIVEYNPLHNGHAWQLQKVKETLGKDTAIVVVMSGPFTQRGEPAVLDKWTRARMALACGASLVLELPVPYATASAERFAFGGVQVLAATGITKTLVFGSEHGALPDLMDLASLLADETPAFKTALQGYLEDLADEWAVKPLFLFRWWDPEDQAYVSRWAGEEWSTSDAETGSAEEIEQFRQRQISRMAILGATAENKPLLEESYRRILAAFEPHVGMVSYLFGSRPSLADFGWFGQLSEMATDPTPMRIMRELAPFTDHWVRRLDDASGVDGEWYPRERALGGMAEALLRIAGELYLPFLAANEQAFAKGLDRLEINVWGLPYALAPFKYQVKCLQQLRARFAALAPADRRALQPVLERSGCWRFLAN